MKVDWMDILGAKLFRPLRRSRARRITERLLRDLLATEHFLDIGADRVCNRKPGGEALAALDLADVLGDYGLVNVAQFRNIFVSEIAGFECPFDLQS